MRSPEASQRPAPPAELVVGWDVGGAHLKACLLQNGQVLDVQQWACPLWQGLQHLDAALVQAAQRWPALHGAWHAITMTGEMVDLFANREAGVRGITQQLTQTLQGPLRFYAGAQGWCRADAVGTHWAALASANWRATASHVAAWAASHPASSGILLDIGSTTTDIIAFRQGQVLGSSQSDAQRLARGELVYQGVVRTPLCALAQRISMAGTRTNVMNEFFATTADVYRLTGELNAAHDLHPPADGASKNAAATQQRLARMVGLDAADASDADWLACAQQWRAAQVAELAGQLHAVCAAHGLPVDVPLVAAGCGAFLASDVRAAAGLSGTLPVFDYGHRVAPVSPQAAAGTAERARGCAPSVAVAVLWDDVLAQEGPVDAACLGGAQVANVIVQRACG